MLINKKVNSEGKPIAVTIKYNGQERTIEPGEKFDVRDFDVPNIGVVNVEKHIMKKNPGALDIISQKADTKEYADYKKEVSALNTTITGLLEQVSNLKDANEELTQKHAAMAGEVAEANKTVEKYQKDAARIVKENKDLEEEVEKLRLRTTGKTK